MLFTPRLSPSSDNALDIRRNAPARQADRPHERVEYQLASQFKDGDIGVLSSRIVVRMDYDS